MRLVIPQPCIGVSDNALSTSMSSVPWTTSRLRSCSVIVPLDYREYGALPLDRQEVTNGYGRYFRFVSFNDRWGAVATALLERNARIAPATSAGRCRKMKWLPT